MKIGLVCPYSMEKHGGVQEVVLALRDGLTQNGHKVKIITPKPWGSETEEQINGDMIFMGTSTDFSAVAHTTTQVSSIGDNEKVDDLLAKEKFDILHFHEPWMPLLSRQLLQRSQSVNVGTFHSKVHDSLTTRTIIKVVNPYLKSVMSYIHSYTAVSPSAASYLEGLLTDESITIIPNGIDLEKYKPRRVSKQEDEKNILFIGRLERRKGVRYLLRAFQLYSKENPGTNLIIAGDGPEREMLELLSEDLKLENVSFLGFISEEEKLDLLARADIFCSPALFGESFGIVLLEAMATGAVCVAGNNSGYVDVMQGVGSMSIVNPEDSAEFARRLDSMMNEQDLRKVWQKWAKSFVQQYDYPNIVSQYEDFYKAALKEHRGISKKAKA